MSSLLLATIAVLLLLVMAAVLATAMGQSHAYFDAAVVGARVQRNQQGDVTLTYEFAEPLPATPPGTSAHLRRYEVPGAPPASRAARLAAALTARRGVPFRLDGFAAGATTVSTNAVPAAAAALLAGGLAGVVIGGRGVMRFHHRSA